MKPSIATIADLEALPRGDRIICLFSGGLDSAYALHLLADFGFFNILAVTVNLGGVDLDPIRTTCATMGVEWSLIDRRDVFASEFVAPAIRAQATYLGTFPISASLSRPCIAQAAVEVAAARNIGTIIHTSTRSQNSLRRFNGAFAGLAYDGRFGSPFAESAVPRVSKMLALTERGLAHYADRHLSTDENIWSRGIEAGSLDDPESIEFPPDSSVLTVLPKRELCIQFEAGFPVSLNGKTMALLSLLDQIRDIGETYRLGRYVGLEEIEGGRKVQEFRVAPTAAILLEAYGRLESACIPAECIREKQHVEQIWVREAVEGRWFGPLRKAAGRFIDTLSADVTGAVTFELAAERMQISGLRASTPLYLRDRNEFERELM